MCLNKYLIQFSLIMLCVVSPTQVLSAPHDKQPVLEQSPAAEKSQIESNQTSEKLSEVTITPAPAGSDLPKTVKLEEEYFYPYSSTMGPRLGLFFDNLDKISEGEYPTSLIGFFYMLPSINEKHWEVGMDLQSNARGSLNAHIKQFFNPSSKTRLFGKFGLSALLDPDKGLANLVAYKQYRLRGGVGIEDLLKDPASLRWDLELTYGLTEFTVALVFGYSWGW